MIMTKTPLTDRMRKRDAPKAWIIEVRKMKADLKKMTEQMDYYEQIIDTLARQIKEQE